MVTLPYGVMGKVKRKRETSKYNEREIEVDEIYRELEAKHSEKFEVPKLRLWARMISSNLHDSIDDPPKIPVFGGSKPKRPRQDLSNALSGAAIALTQALNHKKGTDSDEQSTSISTTTTMQMQVDLRMKNLEQLNAVSMTVSTSLVDSSKAYIVVFTLENANSMGLKSGE